MLVITKCERPVTLIQRPGERLVSRLLVVKLGISTTPVREALFRLASEQALEIDRRNTIVVPVITAERYEEIRDLRRAQPSSTRSRKLSLNRR